MHRAETVDVESRLQDVVESLESISALYGEPVICSLHPRTRDRMECLGMSFSDSDVRYLEPLGLFDFVALEQKTRCVLTDSGTVQEECSIFRVPSVTLAEQSRYFCSEQHLLQAFLAFNTQFEPVLSLAYLMHVKPTALLAACPILRRRGNPPGSFWLRRRAAQGAGS